MRYQEHVPSRYMQWRNKGEGIEGQLYRGSNFAHKCISTTPIGAPIYIYLAPGGNTPCFATRYMLVGCICVRHMVKDHSDSEIGNTYHHIGYSFRLAASVLLYASSHRQDNTVVEHWLEREISQWVHHEGSIRR